MADKLTSEFPCILCCEACLRLTPDFACGRHSAFQVTEKHVASGVFLGRGEDQELQPRSLLPVDLFLWAPGRLGKGELVAALVGSLPDAMAGSDQAQKCLLLHGRASCQLAVWLPPQSPCAGLDW